MRLLRSSIKNRPNHQKKTRELAVIDGALQDWQQLAQGLRPGVETAILDPNRDGIVQITEILSRSEANGFYTTLHIVGHAEPGSLQLGTAQLNRDSLSRYAADLQLWQKLLLGCGVWGVGCRGSHRDTRRSPIGVKNQSQHPTSPPTPYTLHPTPYTLLHTPHPTPYTLLIYGCSFAAGETGQNFLRVLGELTGASIAASSSPVGSAAKGGNWELDARIGNISTPLAFSPRLQQAYAGVFATLNVNSTADNLTGADGLVTLREAIIAANTDATTDLGEKGSGADTIILPAGTYTLALAGIFEDGATTGDLDIGSNITIQGAGSATTTIDAASIDSVLHVLASGVLTLENATVTGGSTGGISNSGTVTVINSTISGNSATSTSGGIFNGGTVTVINSTISDNSATAGSGGISNGGPLTVINSTISGNSAATGVGRGGGIYNFSSGNLTVTNSTITGNSAATGGGIHNAGTVTANNSIISGNTATTINPDVNGIFTGSNNIIGTIGTASGTAVTSAITATAAATINTTLANNGGPTQTHALVAGSLAIDAGSNAAATGAGLTTDQRGTGFARIFNSTVDIGAYEAQPEIDIQGGTPLVSISDGDTTPATADGTDFGSVNVASDTSVSTFTIANTGIGSLLLTGASPFVSIGGTNAADFSVTANPTSPVTGPTGTTTFQVTFDPTAAGTRAATITVGSEDADENPYTFVVQGTGLAPEIDVQGGATPTSIASGDTTPSTADDTDFGSVNVVGGTDTHIFTIQNTGNLGLNLSGTPLVSVSGANAGDFTVTTVPTSPVASGGNTTLAITFDPSATGTRTATITIANDDSDENPYTFVVRGTGLAPEIQVLDGSTDIPDGTTTAQDFGSAVVGGTLSKTFTINNTGTAPLNLSSLSLPTGFSGTLPTTVATGSSATFTVNVDTATAGTLSGTLQFTSDDPDEGTFDFPISATVTAAPEPEIQVLDGSTDIPDGTTTTQDFGSAVVGGTLSKTFTINNTGTAPLNLSSLSLPTGFSGTLPTSVAAGSSATFTVNVDTSAVGTLSGEISFTTDDADETTFNFAISAEVTATPEPEIQVLDASTNIVDGTTTATDFGSTTTGGVLTKTFTVNNLGSADLSLSNLTLPTGFTLGGAFPSTIAAGGTGTFIVAAPSTPGSFSGELSFTTNDGDENPFNFPISAQVIAADIQVLDGANAIADGTTTRVGFGSVEAGGALSRTFTVNNIGTASLDLSNPTLPAGFSLAGTLPATLEPNGSVTFTVNVDTSNPGMFAGVLQFQNSDSDSNPFDFPIAATVNVGPVPIVTDLNLQIPPTTGLATNSGNTTGGQTSDNTTGGQTSGDIIDCTCPPLPDLPLVSLDPGSPNPALAGDDTLIGTPGDDFLAGSTGNDSILGLGGNDILIGGNGSLNSGSGNDNDILFGNGGFDSIQGSSGNDTIYAGQDNDFARGGKDDDLIYGDLGNDTLSGDLGNDSIFGGTGDPTTSDANGQDLIFGGAGNDFLNGNQGNDSLSGGLGNDTVRGGADDDLLLGDSGDDIIYGDNGADHLCGGDGNDTLFGGVGGNAGVESAGQEDTLCGGAGNDLLNGNEGSDKLDGGTGNDTLRGGKDSDTILGGEGSDVLWGDLGNDSLSGGAGSDIFVLSADGGSDVVADFTDGIDAIGLSAGLTFAQLTVSAGANGADVFLGAQLLATFAGVGDNQITEGDFVVV